MSYATKISDHYHTDSEPFTPRRVAKHSLPTKMESSKMTNTERSTYPPYSKAYGSSGGAHAANVLKGDLASKGAAAYREVKANVESVIADAGEKGQQALNYAEQKGQDAMDNVREVGDTFTVAIEKSVTKRPYTTLALAVGLGFLFGATWRRR
jgi:ElaB/YqjD/DUF883 family membrane-anchored ribosome-binding protein